MSDEAQNWFRKHVEPAIDEGTEMIAHDGMTEDEIDVLVDAVMITPGDPLVKLLAEAYDREERQCQIRWALADQIRDLQGQRDAAYRRRDEFLRLSGYLLRVIALLCVVLAGVLIT
jgi:hypothetical protein